MNTKNELIAQFKKVAEPTLSREHPWVKAVENCELSVEQIIAGEKQHYFAVCARAKIYSDTLWKAIREIDDDVVAFAQETVREELCNKKTHADVLADFFIARSISKQDVKKTPQTPGTTEGIKLLTEDIKDMSALECAAVMTLAEWQYGGPDGIAATIHKAYTEHYDFSEIAAKTFSLHAVVDEDHGEAYLNFLAEKVIERPEMQDKIFSALELGQRAFTRERDGYYQAATNNLEFVWGGL